MEVKLAKTAGFCFGVKRAVETVYEHVDKTESKEIYTYGPIIHNDEVVKDLRNKGVEVLNTMDELEALQEGVVIIRSHGVSKQVYNILEERGVTCVDATCPFVKKIHNIDFRMENRTPLGCREKPEFSKYFNLMWKDLDEKHK